jgi:undecaprenyl-diphosphatase
MNHIEAIIIALLQGVSELFPVSSLGHAVLLPKILHWGINEKSKGWLAFLVALHLGTAIALMIYFRNEWIDVVRALVRSVRQGRIATADTDERLAWMVILGTIPAGLVGFVLEKPLRDLFSSPYVAATALIVNGAIMFFGERLIQAQSSIRRTPAAPPRFHGARPLRSTTPDSENRYRDITQLSWRDAGIVGFAQIGALIPGISRSGITMVAGLGAGLTHEASARYAFLLATPIIGAAAVLEIPQLFAPGGRNILGDAAVGMLLAGSAAYLSVRFLMRYFEAGRLYPFAAYSVAAGALSIVLLTIS